MKSENFIPPGGENSYCSFHGNFIQMPGGSLKPWNSGSDTGCCSKPAIAAEGSKKARLFVAKQWAAPCCSTGNNAVLTEKSSMHADTGINTDSIDIFLERVKTHTICISGMAFQDAWTLELDRLKDCLIHVVSRDGKLIPFCAYNLTSADGRSIYRQSKFHNE